EAGQNVLQAAELMGEKGVSSLPVVSKGKLIGIVTEKDMVIRVVARGLNGKKLLVEEIMSYPVAITFPETQLEDATKIMLSKRVRKLPVVEDGHVIGILSLTDVAKAYPEVYSTLKKIVDEVIIDKKTNDFYIA
ncbi:MAG: CBS domain-containing protein, partial [Candidatus Bathyarchaeota archaeon]|nr:CBS domain-containing protein [Candidatus Bathyarchaeota archaeon]